MSDVGVFGLPFSRFSLSLLLESLSNPEPYFLMHPNPTCDFHRELVTLRKWNVGQKEKYKEIIVGGVLFIVQAPSIFWSLLITTI